MLVPRILSCKRPSYKLRLKRALGEKHMKIIKATTSEVPDIVSLNYHVQKIHHLAHPEVFKPAIADGTTASYFENLILQDAHNFHLAYIGSDPVGYVWYMVKENSESPLEYSRKRMAINHIAVHEDFRRKNIGSALLEEVRKNAVERSISSIELGTWQFNIEAQSFFKAHGFENFTVNLWCQVS